MEQYSAIIKYFVLTIAYLQLTSHAVNYYSMWHVYSCIICIDYCLVTIYIACALLLFHAVKYYSILHVYNWYWLLRTLYWLVQMYNCRCIIGTGYCVLCIG